MNQEGVLEINDEEIMTSVNILDESLNILENEIKPALVSKFNALKETDLFNEGLTKLIAQIDSLITSNKNFMTKLTIHADELVQLEAELALAAEQYGSNNWGGSSGNSGAELPLDDIVSSFVDKGRAIGISNVLDAIPMLDETNQTELINFLNVNKGKDVSLNELLFDSENAGLLLSLLKKFYGADTSEVDTEFIKNSTVAQKEVLKLLNQNDAISSKLYDGTILVAKDYLSNVASNNGISFEDLVIDEQYSSVLSNSVKDLYNGNLNGKYKVDSNVENSIKKLIDGIASKNNITTDEIFNNPNYLSLLKGV